MHQSLSSHQLDIDSNLFFHFHNDKLTPVKVKFPPIEHPTDWFHIGTDGEHDYTVSTSKSEIYYRLNIMKTSK